MALVTLAEAKSYLGVTDSSLSVGGLRLSVDAGPTSATVQVKAEILEIVIIGGANPGTYSFSLLEAGVYPTITLLVAVLNASVAAITAEALTDGAALSIDLAVSPVVDCLGSDNEQVLKIVDNYSIMAFINRISDYVYRYCGIQYEEGTLSSLYDGDGTSTLYLDNRPVNTITRICIGRSAIFTVWNSSITATEAYVRVGSTELMLTTETGATTTTSTLTLASYATLTELYDAINALTDWNATVSSGYDSYSPTDLITTEALYCLSYSATLAVFGASVTNYILESASGMITLTTGVFTRGKQNILIDYTYGYAVALVPGGLKEEVLKLISLAYHRSNSDPTLSSEKLGDHSWSRATAGLVSMEKEMESSLALWRNYGLGWA